MSSSSVCSICMLCVLRAEHRELDPESRENIVKVYLKADPPVLKVYRETETQEASEVKAQVRCFLQSCDPRGPAALKPPKHLTEWNVTDRPRSIQLLLQKNKKATRTRTRTRTSSDPRGHLKHENKRDLLFFSPWHFWPNSSSHSLIFYLYYFQIHFVNATWKAQSHRK